MRLSWDGRKKTTLEAAMACRNPLKKRLQVFPATKALRDDSKSRCWQASCPSPEKKGLGTPTPKPTTRTLYLGRQLRQSHLPRSELHGLWTSAYFLSTSFREVHGTFRVMGPFPSVDLRFAVCMRE